MFQDNYVLSLSAIGISFLLALGFTGLARRVLLKRALLDIPNDRSSHKIPVPRGGGWALMAIIIPALLGAMIFIDGSMRHAGLVGAVILLAAISWLDDRKGVNPALRLSLHILAAWLGSLTWTSQQTIFSGAVPFWADRTIMILGWAWFINLYNFMDGIDGITSAETISIAAGVGFCMSAAAMVGPFVSFTTLILTGACLGFLAHNWHPAKIFLGDIGSVPLGYLTGFCLLTLTMKGHLAAALILPLYYLADSGITITRRALRGEKIWQAHRQHFYQYAALGAGRHDRPVYYIIIANIGLILAAIGSVDWPWTGLSVAILIVAILMGKLHKTGSQISAHT